MSEEQILSPVLTIDGLIASGPAPELAEKMMLFGQFVGDWEATGFSYDRDGTAHSMQGEIHFGWILEGRAVQDVWIFPTRPQMQAGLPLDEYGTTIRFYDTKLDFTQKAPYQVNNRRGKPTYPVMSVVLNKHLAWRGLFQN